MSPEEKETMEEKVVQEYSKMPDEVVDDGIEAMGIADNNAAPPLPVAPAVVRSGNFMGADSFHEAAGLASLYVLGSTQYVLRLEDFSVTNGPDLRVLLATPDFVNGTGGDYIELDKLKGNKGNQNYTLPEDFSAPDLHTYTEVVIYCKPFHVVFGSASLE